MWEVKAFFEEGALSCTPLGHTVTVTTEGGGTASAFLQRLRPAQNHPDHTPNTGYHFAEWQVEFPAGLVITNNKFTMPDSNVAIKVIFEEDSPFALHSAYRHCGNRRQRNSFDLPLLAVAGTEIGPDPRLKRATTSRSGKSSAAAWAIENNKFSCRTAMWRSMLSREGRAACTHRSRQAQHQRHRAYTYNGSEHTAQP